MIPGTQKTVRLKELPGCRLLLSLVLPGTFSDGRDLLPRIHQLLRHSQQSCGAASTALALILPGTLSFRVEQSPDVSILAATRKKKK